MIRLLIVDDEQTTREGLLQYVEWRDLGIDMVKAAEDGWEALQISDNFKPDIVLTDVKMPRMDGIQFAMKLKEKLPDCKILFLSSYADKEYLKSAIHLNALDYLEKPVNLDEIRKHVGRAVSVCLEDRKRRQHENVIRNENELLHKEQLALRFITGQAEPLQGGDTEDEKAFPPGAAFATAIIQLHDLSESDLQKMQAGKNTVLENIETRFASFGLNCLRGFKDTHHVIVHAFAKRLDAPGELVNPLALVRNDLEDFLQKPLESFIGVGRLVHRPDRLLDSYHTAAVAVQRQFFKGYNHIIVYKETERQKADPPSWNKDPVSVFAALLEEEQRENEASGLISSMVADMCRHGDVPVNDAKNAFFDLLLTLFQTADRKKVPLSDNRDDKEYLWNVLFRFNTVFEMECYAREKLQLYFEKLRIKPLGNTIAAGIYQYIHLHYEEPGLSIKTIADHLYLTPNYLSLQFKKETGNTINQYITDFRIGKAKELLADRHLKLYEVAALVGIQDANYFAKTFKKVTGMTPSEFKEQHP